MEWLLPYKTKNYHMDEAIHELKSIDWLKNLKVSVGDIAYLYSAKPEMCIKYKCRVIKVDKPKTTIDERKYHGTAIGTPGPCFEIKLEYEFNKPIAFKELEKHGVKRTRIPVQTSKAKPDLFLYLKDREKKDRSLKKQASTLKRTRVTSRQSLEIKAVEKDLMALKGAERDAVVKRRLNHSSFKRRLVKKYGACCMCGVDDTALLIASHIKPWSRSNGTEKLDTNNGLLLCPNHDKAFDSGLISFANNGKILISKKLNKKNRGLLCIDGRTRITVDEGMRKYLDYHRENRFKR